MAYKIERGEPVPQSIKRMAKEQLEAAVESLESRGKRDEAIHDARKRAKKTRALLRLVKDELGDLYATENTRLRDAGRGLSEFRDAAAAIETFDDLLDRFREDLHGRPLDSIRRGLVLHKSRGERRANMKQALEEITSTFDSAARRVGKWPLVTDGFAALAPGLKRTFRRGRKAMAQAHANPRPETYHEWRKRVKDLWYHARLLEDLWAEIMGGYVHSLKQLEDWLGTDHNLVVLRAKVTAEPDFYGSSEDIQQLVELIEKREKELRGCSHSMGKRVYLENPGDYTQRLEGLWEAWQG